MNGVEIIVHILIRAWGTLWATTQPFLHNLFLQFAHDARWTHGQLHAPSWIGLQTMQDKLRIWDEITRIAFLIWQFWLRNEDLLQSLIDFQGNYEIIHGNFCIFTQKAKAHLSRYYVHTQQFTRIHLLFEQHPETWVNHSFVLDGGMLSTDPHEQLIALER